MGRGAWWTGRAIGAHLSLLLVEPAFAALTDWQVHRALGGNELSWAYVFEWPIFSVYAIVLWWRIVHGQAEAPGVETGERGAAPGGTASSPAVPAPADEPASREARELAAYNRYLAALHAGDRRRR